jgi:hypothetical protein
VAGQGDSVTAAERDAEAIAVLVRAGFDMESVIDAIEADDMSLLAHTGECNAEWDE